MYSVFLSVPPPSCSLCCYQQDMPLIQLCGPGKWKEILATHEAVISAAYSPPHSLPTPSLVNFPASSLSFHHPLMPVSWPSLCLRCVSGTTFAHLFSCFLRLQGSGAYLWSWLAFYLPPCTPVINFVHLLFCSSQSQSTLLSIFSQEYQVRSFFLCEAWQVLNWMMNVPLFLCNWTASPVIGLEDVNPSTSLPSALPPPLIKRCLILSGCLPSFTHPSV